MSQLINDSPVPLDPRFLGEQPLCFLCGLKIYSSHVLVSCAAAPALAAHAACASDMTRTPTDLLARYWQAVRAAITGKAETPNPGPAIVRGFFR